MDLKSRLRSARVIVVLGASDTGKTALIQELLAACQSSEAIGVLDCDVGQSHLGPPSTVAWARASAATPDWTKLPVVSLAFTGDLSPAGNLVPTLEAIRRIYEAASQQSDRLLIDTTGLVQPDFGPLFKRRKMTLIQPDLILGLQKREELEEVVQVLRDEARWDLELLSVAPAVRTKTPEERAQYRWLRFQTYFEGARISSWDTERTAVRLIHGERGTVTAWPEIYERPAEHLVDRLVSLRDVRGEDLAIGRVVAWEPGLRRLDILAPLEEPDRVTTLLIGKARAPDSPTA